MFKPVANRLRPCGAARNNRDFVGGRVLLNLIGVQNQNDMCNLIHRIKCRQGSVNHPLPGQHLPLFGPVAPGAGAATGGNDDGGCCHGS